MHGGQDGNTSTVVKKRTSPGTPFITNSAKEVFSKKKEATTYGEKKPKEKYVTQSQSYNNPSTLEPTLKLELFAPAKEPEIPQGIYNPYMPVVNIPGVNKRFSSSAFQNLSVPQSALSYVPNVQMPIQNVYNINTPGPTGGHVEMSKIYDNHLPNGKDGRRMTSKTLGERFATYNFIKQTFGANDGDEMSVDSSGSNSLLSYIKFLEMNPNYYNPLSDNPYNGLPYGLLIYRSCYPVTIHPQSQSVVCAKDSVGLNIRLYSLTHAEYMSYVLRQKIRIEYDIWRELAYYDYVKNNILKQYQSPNFPIFYAFYTCKNNKIDFFSLKKKCLTQKQLLTKEYKMFELRHKLLGGKDKEIVRPLLEGGKRYISNLPDEIDPELQRYSGNLAIFITEAYHSNFYQWASRLYEVEGVSRKMVSQGWHLEPVWLSVYFQIIHALYVLQVNGIYIRDMTLEDNIYIKDLQVYGKANGYWEYVVDDISYYVPNYGYLVMVDTNFKDIIPEDSAVENCKRQYKIYTSDIFGKTYRMDAIRNKVYDNYRNIINTNCFTEEHTKNNVFRPPPAIMDMLKRMMADPETYLGKIISNHFRGLMHNRIGTYLRKDTEIPNLRDITSNLKVGELAAEVLAEENYKWALISAPVNDAGIIKIITRTDPKSPDFIEKDVRIETLRKYSEIEKVEQNICFDLSYTNEELLETYYINSSFKNRSSC